MLGAKIQGQTARHARQPDGAGQRLDRVVLAEHHRIQVALEVTQALPVGGRDVLGRDAGDLGHHRFDVLDRDHLAPAMGRQQHLGGADLVDHIDGLVRQLAVGDEARRQAHGGVDGIDGVAYPVVLLVIGLEPLEDLDRFLDRRLVDVDLLEAADQRPVLLEIVAVFLIGGRSDASEVAAGKGRLEKVRGVHRAAAGGAGADDRMDLVDKEDHVLLVGELGQHRLDALLEIAAVPGAGKQRPHVEGVDRRVFQHVRHLAVDDAPRQPLGDGGLADPGLADVKRVVLGPPAEDLDGALDLVDAPDQGIDLAGGGLLVEVDAVGVQRLVTALDHLFGLGVLVRPVRRAPLGAGADLGDAVRDVVDRVEARHFLLLEEIDGVRFALREQRHQDVGAGHFLAARGLHVYGGALQHPLEAGGGLGVLRLIEDQPGKFVVDVSQQILAQPRDIDAAGAHHGDGVLILRQRQQKMLQGCELVMALLGESQRAMQGLFQVAR